METISDTSPNGECSLQDPSKKLLLYLCAGLYAKVLIWLSSSSPQRMK